MFRKSALRKSSKKGFSLWELMLASAILVFALTGILAFFLSCILLNETSRNIGLAYTALESKMEEIKNTSFGTLDALNGTTFNLNGFLPGDGTARITVSPVSGATARLKNISLSACFRVRNRVVGDSLTNCQSSPVGLDTLIAE